MPPDQETGDQTDWIFVQLALMPFKVGKPGSRHSTLEAPRC